jgi:beta-glucosidase
MGFDGLVATDAMIMDGVLRGRGELRACVEALRAGCDLILYPADPEAVLPGVVAAAARGELDERQLRSSVARRDRRAAWAAQSAEWSGDAERKWAKEFARSCVSELRGRLRGITASVDIVLVDDDVGGPYPPPSREPFRAALASRGVNARWVDAAASGEGSSVTVVALFGDIRSWKGRAGYGEHSIDALKRIVERNPEVIVVQFSHPRIAAAIPDAVRHVITAWGGERTMQEAAAGWLAERARSRGS